TFIVEQFTLDTTITGGGSITATGIACPGDCTEDYDTGTVVALTPIPDLGFVFDSWSGAGCATGSVTMNADRSCTATFIVEQFTLNTSITGDGGITAAGISCPGDCTEDYDTGTSVVLTALPNAGFVFDSWTGTGCATGTVAMTEDRACTANFVVEQFTLDTSITGGGSITATGIACPGDCTEDYDTGTVVALTPTPDLGFVFDSWTGTGCASGTVAMTEDRACTANFVVEQFTLNTSITGGGSITAAGISCPGDCMEIYNTGTVVALTPAPGPGFVFDGWTGDADCSDGSVTMTTDRSCTANFILNVFDLSINLAGAGIGNVSAAGIDCGDGGVDCSASYTFGTVVNLTTLADPSSIFTGFAGHPDCLDGSVTIDSDKTCIATFDISIQPLILSPISPGFTNHVNIITAEGASPNDRVAFVWGFRSGSTILGGSTCNGLELGIQNLKLLGIGTTSSDQVAEFVFFIPQLGDSSISILTQAVNLSNCNSSEVVETITRTE
ncbi:MAG: hypothetical protein WBC96_04770, partial [Thermodesulfobacteriota bacterium]